MKATTVGDLRVGQYGCFDPLYGPELILHRHVYWLGPDAEQAPPVSGSATGIRCVHLHLLGRGSGPTGRFVVRAESEPVVMFDLDAGLSFLGARSGDATQVAKDPSATGPDRQPAIV